MDAARSRGRRAGATFAYDGSGFVETMVAYIGMIARTSTVDDRDGVGRVLALELPDLEVLGLGWDEEGRLVSVTPPDKPQHTMSYDPAGMLEAYEPPSVGITTDHTYAYDLDHRLVLVTLPDAATIDIDYDEVTSRVEAITTSEGATITPIYDAAGRIETLTGPYAGVQLDYAYAGPLVVQETWSGIVAGSVARVIDSRGLPTSQSVNGGSTVSFTYDGDDLLLSTSHETLSRSATTGWVESITLGGIEQTLSYDTFGEVDGSDYVNDGTDGIYGYELVRDQLGRIVQQTETFEGGTPVVWDYAYDVRGRLEHVDRDGVAYATYAYDGNGNRLSVTTSGTTTNALYDEQDRLNEYGGAEYLYGQNGEIREKIGGIADSWAYDYDALGNLRSVTLPDTTEISYEYDARGRVVARYVDGVFDKGWLWANQLEPIAEVDEQGNVTARYVYASRGHVPDYVIKGGETYRIVTDYRGSVVRVVDADGVVVQAITYGPWGEVIAETGAGFQSFGYAGGIWDADTRLVRFGARLYDAEIGRWTSKDPLLWGGRQTNLYAYAKDDPINYVDISGHVPGVAYGSEQEAAVEAARWMQIILPQDDFVSSEFAGLIYEIDGAYFHTPPHTNPGLGPDHAQPGAALGDCPAGSLVTAGYHTHPPLDGYDQHLVSPGDRHYVEVATPLYMVIVTKGGKASELFGLAQWPGESKDDWAYHFLEMVWP